MTAGRPTKYDAAFCDQIVELGREGKSIAQMAAHFDVCRQTVDNWCREHPEFLEAFRLAKTHMQAALEQIGSDNLHDKDFNTTLWRTIMQARFRDEYTETRSHKVNAEIAGDLPKPLPPDRDIARAILAILGSAVVDDENEESDTDDIHD